MKNLCRLTNSCMKKPLWLALLGLSVAGAQSWNVEGPFRDDFLGCTRLSTGQVQCTMKSTYTGSGSTYYGATYYARDTAAYAPDRQRFLAVRSFMDGRDVTNATVNVSKASPVTVAYVFNYPAQHDKITMLFMDSGILKDVPIKGAAPTSAPQPSTTQPSTAQPAPAQPAASQTPAATKPAAPSSGTPASAASAVPSITLSSFDLKLTGCTATSQGGLTCTRAELVPRR